ncbi:MAG: iron chelate uptake ABC transporter family permease subunit [Defluviitaleaceae bacterium]|nr:iron chelate uptake ABC transporter family permease subunit [Defluviitaleaceae bacterium]
MKLLLTISFLIILSAISLFIGPVSIGNIFDMTFEQQVVMFASRVPRLISVIITGIGMSIAGLIMQCLTKNKFVAPTTAGTMDGARLGILISMMAGVSSLFMRSIFAFVFTLLTTLIFIKIINKIKIKNIIFVPLVGIMYGNILASVAMYFAYTQNIVQNLNTWLIGDFSSVLRGRYEILYITIPMIIIAYIFADKFIIAGMGKDFSKNLGVNYNLVLNIGMIIVSILSTAVLLTVGVIPFLGVVVPNIVSILFGDNLKKTLPIVAIGGAIFLLICDIISRLIIHPFEIPISLTVGIIGGAIFLFLLLRRRAYA